MARRMLSLAAVLSPRRWRSAPAVRCLQSTRNRSRVSYMSSLRSLCLAVQGQAELAPCKGTSNPLTARPTKSSRYAFRTAKASYEPPTPARCKSSGFESRDFKARRALATHASRRVIHNPHRCVSQASSSPPLSARSPRRRRRATATN